MSNLLSCQSDSTGNNNILIWQKNGKASPIYLRVYMGTTIFLSNSCANVIT